MILFVMILPKHMKKLLIACLLRISMASEWLCNGLITQGLLIVMVFKPIQVEVCGLGEIGLLMPTTQTCLLINLPLNKLLVTCFLMPPNLKLLLQDLIGTTDLMEKVDLLQKNGGLKMLLTVLTPPAKHGWG